MSHLSTIRAGNNQAHLRTIPSCWRAGRMQVPFRLKMTRIRSCRRDLSVMTSWQNMKTTGRRRRRPIQSVKCKVIGQNCNDFSQKLLRRAAAIPSTCRITTTPCSSSGLLVYCCKGLDCATLAMKTRRFRNVDKGGRVRVKTQEPLPPVVELLTDSMASRSAGERGLATTLWER